jgi:hypothetical protein
MDISRPEIRQGAVPPASCTLRVEAVFRELGEQQLETVAAAMIDRAHELANRPECECDVDVSVERGSPAPPFARDAGGGGEATGFQRGP